MTNALTVYDQFDELQRAAIALKESGYFKDVTSKAQAIVKVMAGAELGLPPFASMTGIHIIQGKPVLGANVLATLVKNDPRYDYRVKKINDSVCALEWFENGKSVGESAFTDAEAKNAGLTGKDNWKKYPSDMLFARAISRGARRFAPGIFGGSPVYTPDEMGADVDENGAVIVESVAVDVTHIAERNPNVDTINISPSLKPSDPIIDKPPELPPTGNGSVFDAVVDAKLSENAHAAKAALQNYCKTGYDTPEKAVAWMKMYRGWKDSNLTTVEAAEKANAGLTPK